MYGRVATRGAPLTSFASLSRRGFGKCRRRRRSRFRCLLRFPARRRGAATLEARLLAHARAFSACMQSLCCVGGEIATVVGHAGITKKKKKGSPSGTNVLRMAASVCLFVFRAPLIDFLSAAVHSQCQAARLSNELQRIRFLCLLFLAERIRFTSSTRSDSGLAFVIFF